MSVEFDFELLFDSVMSVLLLVTIVYAALLNRKLSALRGAREEMQGLVEEFTTATTRAELGLAQLKEAAEASGSVLQEKINGAKDLVADINFVVKRGDEVAGRMEDSLRAARRTLADPLAARPQQGAAARSSERPSAFRAARADEIDFAALAPTTRPNLGQPRASQIAAGQSAGTQNAGGQNAGGQIVGDQNSRTQNSGAQASGAQAAGAQAPGVAKRALSSEQSQLLKALQGMR